VFHDAPNVLHYRSKASRGLIMREGHIFTIEPMISSGKSKSLHWPDQWTAATADGKPSAQFEHTLLITRDGVEELTAKLPTSPKFPWEK
jgi:methionyl aminopeptidase